MSLPTVCTKSLYFVALSHTSCHPSDVLYLCFFPSVSEIEDKGKTSSLFYHRPLCQLWSLRIMINGKQLRLLPCTWTNPLIRVFCVDNKRILDAYVHLKMEHLYKFMWLLSCQWSAKWIVSSNNIGITGGHLCLCTCTGVHMGLHTVCDLLLTWLAPT